MENKTKQVLQTIFYFIFYFLQQQDILVSFNEGKDRNASEGLLKRRVEDGWCVPQCTIDFRLNPEGIPCTFDTFVLVYCLRLTNQWRIIRRIADANFDFRKRSDENDQKCTTQRAYSYYTIIIHRLLL